MDSPENLAGIQLPARIRLWQVISSIVVIVVLCFVGLQFIVVPVALLVGFALACIGLTAVPRIRGTVYSHMPKHKARSSELGAIAIAIGLGLLSVAVWVPLFTFSSWWFWHTVSLGPVFLWSCNTCLYAYTFVMTQSLPRTRAQASETDQGQVGETSRSTGPRG